MVECSQGKFRGFVHSVLADYDQGVEYAVKKTTEEWRDELSGEQFYVLRQKGTERPGTGEYDKFFPKDGHFACGACLQPLYSAAAKFDSGCVRAIR